MFGRHHEDPVRITTAHRGHSDDLKQRQTRYLISMGIRTACFVLAVVTTGYWRWAFAVGAFVLPYIAVVIANAGQTPDPGGPDPFDKEQRPELPPGKDHDDE